MNVTRLKEWYEDEVGDVKLTAKEVKWLATAVDNAVTQKILERTDVHTFPDAKGVH
jgi:hypothetical protein